MNYVKNEEYDHNRNKTMILRCTCGARAKNTCKERPRFLRRHPYLCNERGIRPQRDDE